MSALDSLYIMRGVERIVIALAGMLSIFCGYHLFIKGVNGKASLYVGAEDKRFSFRLLNAAPGIFFCLFGVVLLLYAINKGVEVRPTEQRGKIDSLPGPSGPKLHYDPKRLDEVQHEIEESSPSSKSPGSPLKSLEAAKAADKDGPRVRYDGPAGGYDPSPPRPRPPSK